MAIKSMEELRKRFHYLGYVWPSIHIVGIRSNNQSEEFPDFVGLVEVYKIHWYRANTGLTSHWSMKFFHKKPNLVLKPGQYKNSFKMYDSVIAQSKPMTFDNRGESIFSDESIRFIPYGDMNIFKAITCSPGSQRLKNKEDYEQLSRLCKSSFKSNYTYTLLDDW